LNEDQIIATFGSMNPDSAAQILLQMADLNPAKVLDLLSALPPASRADVIEAMNKQNSKYTAQLVNKLVNR